MKLKAGSLIKNREGDKLLDWTRKREDTNYHHTWKRRQDVSYITKKTNAAVPYTTLHNKWINLNEMETKFLN